MAKVAKHTKGNMKSSGLPPGHNPDDFEYMGRPATDQGDFGTDVGIADMACVNQFGEANNAKGYHGGVVRSKITGEFHVYVEWGRIAPGKSWEGGAWTGNFQSYQFTEGVSEDEARAYFAKQMNSKNTKRLERKMVAGVEVWAGRKGKDGYIVQSLATREKGLPDACAIKDDSGVSVSAGKAAASRAKAGKSAGGRTRKPTSASPTNFQPEVVRLAQALVGGTQTYTRSLAAAAGVTPTMDAIERVRDQLVPAALHRIKAVGGDVTVQVKDQDLRSISKMVAALVPRPIAREGQSDEEAILSGGNILALQADLDAFEAALHNEDFSVDSTPVAQVDPDRLLNAQLRHIALNSTEGRWLSQAFESMSHNRHGYLRNPIRMKTLFAVERPDRDAHFMSRVETVAGKRRGNFTLRANLQPRRTDLGAHAKLYGDANVALGIHGTRPVNIAPIMGGNFRLPKSLPGAQITGANFGHGIYMATDFRKSVGYTGFGYWGGGGAISGRGMFLFLCDMVVGKAYRAPSTGSWNNPPNGCDSVFGVGGDRNASHHLENDEHVIFQIDYQRIRYLVETEPPR